MKLFVGLSNRGPYTAYPSVLTLFVNEYFFHLFGPHPKKYWMQPDGFLDFEGVILRPCAFSPLLEEILATLLNIEQPENFF